MMGRDPQELRRRAMKHQLPPGQTGYVDVEDDNPLCIRAQREGKEISICLAIRAGVPSDGGGSHIPTVDECDVCSEPVWRSNRLEGREHWLLVCTFCAAKYIG